MTAYTVSPIKPIYRLDHLKIPLLGIKQRPSETFQTAFAGFRLTLKSLFTLTAQIGSGSKQNVGGRVQRSFCRVLNHADDEADGNHLHGHIVIDTEQAARQRNQQQRATGHTGCTARADSSHQAQQQGGGEVNRNALRVRRSHRQNGNGDCRTGHIDGCTQWNGDGVSVFVQTQFFSPMPCSQGYWRRKNG